MDPSLMRLWGRVCPTQCRIITDRLTRITIT